MYKCESVGDKFVLEGGLPPNVCVCVFMEVCICFNMYVFAYKCMVLFIYMCEICMYVFLVYMC